MIRIPHNACIQQHLPANQSHNVDGDFYCVTTAMNPVHFAMSKTGLHGTKQHAIALHKFEGIVHFCSLQFSQSSPRPFFYT